MCHVSCVMCHVSCIMCHVSFVMCHVSRHVSCVMYHIMYPGVPVLTCVCVGSSLSVPDGAGS